MQLKFSENSNLMDTSVNLVDLDDDLPVKKKGGGSMIVKGKGDRNMIVKRKGGGSIIDQRPLFSSDGE